eukprot:6210736-Pleurochrysis_carterae.AAC.1
MARLRRRGRAWRGVATVAPYHIVPCVLCPGCVDSSGPCVPCVQCVPATATSHTLATACAPQPQLAPHTDGAATMIPPPPPPGTRIGFSTYAMWGLCIALVG